MTVHNEILKNSAKALNGESYNTPTHNVVATTEVTSIDVTATTLSGIIGTATAVTSSRDDVTVNFNGIRSSTSVVDSTNGDTLKTAGLFDAASGGTVQVSAIINELHTTSFDLEFDYDLLYTR